MEMEENKKSRHRGENWSEEEKTLFLDIMKDSAKIVDNKLTDTNTNKQKSLEWFHVQSKLRKLTGKNRDIAQLKGFWRRTKTSAKKGSSGYYRVLNVSDETYKPPSPSQEDPLIITVCPMDFINNANECESDGISGKEVRGKRPFKIWDSSRNVRKGLVVTSFEELIHRGKEKLSVGAGEPVRLVLESDGTQVEDGDYWRTLPPNTVLLLLRQGERWYPTGVDVIKAAISAIPKIVCETIHALELHDETPSWKIMDNKGRVTVVLHWDQRPAASPAARSPSRQPKPDRRPSLVIQTSLERPQPPPPHITVVNHDEPGPARARLTRAPGSLEHHPPPHVHTAECRAGSTSPAQHSHAPTHRQPQDECDFHCCALHEEGRRIAVHKSVATSPIQDAQPRASPQGRPKGHVRFLDAESARRGDRDSSESETENTLVEDEAVTSEKFLLLIDQLSVDQKRHLTIKDIGIILERLSSKILDVERLDRESESDDCYNWTIKATIRGDALRELGVIYNGNYYAISEHPGYREENEEAADEGEEEEEEDRL